MGTSRRALLKLAALSPAAMPAAFGAAAAAPEAAAAIDTAMARLRPLCEPKTPPAPGDWLADHKEPGQTYAQYRALTPRRAIDSYSTLRLVPIGPLTKGQGAVLTVTKDFLKAFFGLRLVVDAPVSMKDIPESAQRVQYHMGPKQLLTSYLLNEALTRRRQGTDAAVLGITAFDLWPGPGWNFVFGQASLKERVGVWSMARSGDANESPAMRALCALRTAMTATHETGHMFGIRHCIAYECGMNGSNHADERDRQPLEFCAECQPKLWWTLGLDPLARSRALEGVARAHGFDRLARIFARQTAALAGNGVRNST